MELTRENLSKEVSKFRSAFNEDALSTAEKSISLKRLDSVAIILLDQLNSKANKLSTPNMLRLFELLCQVEQDLTVDSLLILSRKPSIFIAGADISEIQSLNSGQQSPETLMKLQAVLNFLEGLPIPTLAAIHGACLGGGLELALACDYRIVTDAKETKLGLPEVMLGIMPGWGGTQRLPRLVGLQTSLDSILTGRNLDGKSAFRKGLADRLAPVELLEEKAVAWAKELAAARRGMADRLVPEGLTEDKAVRLKEKLTKARIKRSYDKPKDILERAPGGKWLIFDQARKKVLEKTRGNYPAPLKALSIIRETYGGKLESGLKKEAKAFMELVVTPEANNLINVFYLTEKVKKDKGVATEVAPLKIQKAAVLGAGVMGGGIAQLLAAKDYRTRLKDINWDAIKKGYQTAYGLFRKLVKKRKLTKYELTNKMELIEGTTTYSGFKSVDVVIEAIVEDLEIKSKVFQELGKITSSKTLLATNTSSIPITEIAKSVSDPSRVVGMHFFNPVHKMPLIEVIRGQETSDAAVATIVDFSKKLGKTPVVVNDAPGFVVNRILTPYLLEAMDLVFSGVTPEEVDEIMVKFGMPMGPCELLDEVGLDVAGKVAHVLFGAFGERMKPPEMMDIVTKEGHLGKKVSRGIYLYDEKGKKKHVDNTLFSRFTITKRDEHLTDETVERRMTYGMVNEAARVLSEGLVRHPSDVDVAMIFGTGFAPFRGGLLRHADTVGIETIVGDLELFTRNYGMRFQPCQYLQSLAVEKKGFYSEN